MKLPIAETIPRLRREKDITQEEVAREIGVTYQSVSRWENGQAYPDMELIPKIAGFFEISTDVLFGTDRNTKENKLKEHYKKIYEVQNEPQRLYSVCKNAYEEFPREFSFGLWLCRCYIDMNIRPYKDHLDEIRDICGNILENCTIEDYRIEAMHMIAIAEDEERLDQWLDKVPCWKSCREILMETRYKYHNDIGKLNLQRQKNLRTFLEYSFYNCISEDNSNETAEGLNIVLSIINNLRNTSTDYDAWITTRANILLRISGLYFTQGDTEKGYTVLEQAVDLYEKYAKLPLETELSYNSVLLNLLSENKKCDPGDDTKDKGEYVCFWAYQALTKQDGCFSCVRKDERFKNMTKRLIPYLPNNN